MPLHSPQYYGDKVRTLLISAGVLMVVSIPLFPELIPKPAFFSIIAVLVLVILSGLSTPRHKVIASLNIIVSAVAFVVFEYYAIDSVKTFGVYSPFFIANEILALIFLSATYFSTKTVDKILE